MRKKIKNLLRSLINSALRINDWIARSKKLTAKTDNFGRPTCNYRRKRPL
jgi:hypothetical protein